MLFKKNPTALDRIARMIGDTGPIGVGAFMHEALIGEYGYYRRAKDPLGVDGDFITAPEISQIFGELIGLWCVEQWKKLNYPQEFAICELGPGRGTLLADALRGAAQVGNGLKQARIFLCEANPLLRQKQFAALPDVQPQWIENLDELPRIPIIFIANEFFDALPAEQIVYRDGRWHLRKIDYDADAKKLFFCVDTNPYDASQTVEFQPQEPQEGDIFEFSPESWRWLYAMAQHAKDYGAAALMIDYGHLQPGFGETLQAVRRHQKTDPLLEPGEADLTCHVDFAAMRRILQKRGLYIHDFTTQRDFLIRCGIQLRLKQLLAKATPAQQQSLQSGVERLTLPRQMGNLFKVLSFASYTA